MPQSASSIAPLARARPLARVMVVEDDFACEVEKNPVNDVMVTAPVRRAIVTPAWTQRHA